MVSNTKSYLLRSIHSGAVAGVFLLALLNDVCLAQQRGRSRAGVGIAVAAGAANGGQLVDFDCPEEFGYYPHPNDCTQYYVCVFGGALLESCTGGLMYSHELQTCDWPRNVGCGAEESATISTVRVTDPRTRQTTASGASPRTAPISRGQQQREQQQRQQQDEIAKHQLYADDLGPAEEVETDRQQRVYRGQPSGQVTRDRDGLRHQVTNAIPASPGRVASGDKVSVISFGTGLQQQQQQQQQQYSFDELILDKNSLLTNETLHHGSRKKRQVAYRFQGQSGPVFQLIHSGLNEFPSVTVPLSNNEANYNNYQNLQPGNGNNNLPIPIPTPVLRPSNPSPPPSSDNDFRPIVNPGVPNKDIRNFQSQENYHTSGQRPPPNLPYTKTNGNFKFRPPQTQNPLTSPDNLRQLLPLPPTSSKPNPAFSAGGPRSYTNFQQNTGVVILPNGPSGTPQSFFNQQVLHNQRETSPSRSHPSSNENQFNPRGPNTHNDNRHPEEENYSYLLIQKPNEDVETFLARTTENPFYSTSRQQQQSTPTLSFVTGSQTFPAGTGILQFSQDALSLEEVHKHEQRATGHQHSANPSTPSPATPSQYNAQGVRQTWQKLLREQQQSERWSPSTTRATTVSSESTPLMHSNLQVNANAGQQHFTNQQFSEHNNRVSPTQTQNDHPFKPNAHPYGDIHNVNTRNNEFLTVSRNPSLQNKEQFTNREQFPESSYIRPLNVQQTQQSFLYNENSRYVEKAEPNNYRTVQNNGDSRSQLYKDLNQAIKPLSSSESASVPVNEYESVKLPNTQEVNRFIKSQQPSEQYDDYEDYEEDDELENHYSYRARPYYDEENSEEENKTFRPSQNTRTQKLPSNSAYGRAPISTLNYKNQKEESNNDQQTQEHRNERKQPLQSQISQISAEEEYDETRYKTLSLEDRDKRIQSTTIRSIPVERPTKNHLPGISPQNIPENEYQNTRNTFGNPEFDLEEFIDQITGVPKNTKEIETITFNENGEPQVAVENLNHRQPKEYIKPTTSHTESSTPNSPPRIVRTRHRTRLPVHIDLSQRRRPITRTTTTPEITTVVPTTTTRLRQSTENLREHFATQNLKSEGIGSSLPDAQPTASLSYTNYNSKDDIISSTTIKSTSFSPVPIVITNHRPADGKPDPLTVPFYHGADGNFYAHPVHREITEIHSAAPDGEEYFRYSVDDSPSQHSDGQGPSNPTTDTIYYVIDSNDSKYSSTAPPGSTALPQRENNNSSLKKPLGSSSETSRNSRRRLPRPQIQKNQSTETFGSSNDFLSNKNPAYNSYEEMKPQSTGAPSLVPIPSFQPHPFTIPSSVKQDNKVLKALEGHSPESSMPKPFTEQTPLEEDNTKGSAKDTNMFAELTDVSVKPVRNNEGRQQLKARQNLVSTSALPTASEGTSTEYVSLEQNINKNAFQRGYIHDSERTQSTQLKKPSFSGFAYNEAKNSSFFQEATEALPVPFQRGNQAFAYSERPTIQTSTVTTNELLQSVYDIAHVTYKQPQFGLSPNNRPQIGVLAPSAVFNSNSDASNSRKTYPSAVHSSSTLKPADTRVPNYNITSIHNQSRWQINVPEYQDNQPTVAYSETKHNGSGFITSTNPTHVSRNNTIKSIRRHPTSSNLLVRHRVRRPNPTATAPSTSSITPINHVSPNDINSIVNIQTTLKPPTPTSPSQNRVTYTTSPRRQNRRPTKTTTSTTESFTDRNRSKLIDRPQSDERLLNRKPPASTPETGNKGHYSNSAAISTVATRVEPSNPPVTYIQQAPAPSPSVYNNSQHYEASQYDPYYNLYDDEVELYKDVDYGQFSSSQQSDRQTTTQQQQQQQYRGQSPYKQVPQPPPQEQRNAAYAQPSYNTQQDVYSQNVDVQDYNENYNTAADDQGQYGQQAARQPVKTPARSGKNESNFTSQRPSTTTTTTTTTTSTTIRTTTAVPSTTTATVAPERQQTRLRTESYTNTINNAAENYSPRARISTTMKSTPFPADFDTPYILTLQNQKPTRQTPSGQHDSPQSRTVTLTTAFSLLDPFSTEQSKTSTSQSRGRGQPSNRVSIESFGDSSTGRKSSQTITLGAPVSRSSSRNQGGTNNSRKTATASFVVVDDSKSSNLQGFSLEDEVAAIESGFNTQQSRKQGNEIQSRSRNPPQYSRNQENKRLTNSESTVDRSRLGTVSSRRPVEPDTEFIQIPPQSRRTTDSLSLTSAALVNDGRNPPHSRRTSESSDGSNADSSRIRRPPETPSNPATSRNNLELPSTGRATPQSRNSNEPSSDSVQTLTQSRRPSEPSPSLSSGSKQRSSPTRNNADSEALPKSRVSNPEKETPSSPRSSYRANIVEADDVQSGLAQNSIEQQSETRSRQRGSNQRKSTSCNDAIDTNANTGCDESPSQIRVRPTTAPPESQSTPTPSRGSNSGRTRGSYTTGTGVEPTVNRGTPASVSRSRPTLKPSTAIVSKAQEFVDIYKYPASRPEPVYPTPQVDKTAAKCRKDVCLLPDCYCGGKEIPGDLPAEQVPQLVMLTFDDAINDLNKGLYSDIFEKDRKNPNGCPISATFYVSHEWTDYSQAQNLYADGHEMASHSISHSFGEQFSQKKWTREIAGQREILAAYGGVRMEDIRGMRAPFLAIGGNKMFKMLYDSNFTYDSSMPVYENRPPSWPYTLDYKIFHDCMIPPCPTRSYPGVWEVPMVMWQDLNGGRCSMGDACSNPPTSDGVYKMLIKNFERHYTTNRAPFGLFYHAAWFTQPHHKEGFIAFLDTIVNMQDVWLVTNWQAIQWVRDPTPLSRIKNFPPFQCNYPERPRKCNNPKVCNLWHKSGVRYMRTCQPCPEVYPWTGKTGVRNSRVDNEIIEE